VHATLPNLPYLGVAIYQSSNTYLSMPEMKLLGLVPNFYIHVFVSDLYIPSIGPPVAFADRSVGIYKFFPDT
jgi:hypothetical protein